MIKTAPFRVEDYLDTSEAIAAYLSEALATEDAKYVARAIGNVARSTQGMTVIARETGLSREGLYKSLGTDGNPELATVIKVLRAFGVQLAATEAAKHELARAEVGGGRARSVSAARMSRTRPP